MYLLVEGAELGGKLVLCGLKIAAQLRVVLAHLLVLALFFELHVQLENLFQ